MLLKSVQINNHTSVELVKKFDGKYAVIVQGHSVSWHKCDLPRYKDFRRVEAAFESEVKIIRFHEAWLEGTPT